ncbi:hypothetical protein V8D89_008384 [Ganoderma adspersum]
MSSATVSAETLLPSTEIDATDNRALSLPRRARSSLVNIDDFPEELLCAIFVWLGYTDVAEKMHIANTCRRWREVCLAFPDFWTDFTAFDETCGLIDEALSRSRSRRLPLTVSVSQFDRHWPAVVFALGLHGDAIRSLSLCSELCGRLNEVLGWQTSFPCLQELRLAYQPQVGLMGTFEADVLPEAPQAPQLETVVLTNCRWPYAPRYYRGIRSLSLVCETDTDRAFDDVLQGPRRRLCDALAGSPQLEELTLYHPFMHADEVLADNSLLPPVPLLRLRSLRVCMAVEKAAALLSRIHTSADTLETAILVLTPWTKLPGSRRPKPDPEALLALPRPSTLPILTRLRSLHVTHDFARMTGGFGATPPAMPEWRSLVRCGPEFPECEPGLYVHLYGWPLHCSLGREAFGNFFSSVLEHYTLESLETLGMERLSDWRQAVAAVRLAPRIQTLVFALHTMPDLVLQAVVDRRGQGFGEAFLPELRVVRVVDLDLEYCSGLLIALRDAASRLGLISLSFEECRSWRSESEIVELVRGERAGLDVRCTDLLRCPHLKPSYALLSALHDNLPACHTFSLTHSVS